ncbi:MAG: sulfotransferase [Phycisphaerales bacterium]|nr:sulfotransferase [Phycisphaerales bacterium]
MSTPDPNTISFIMAGCQRCGSTWVDAALREYPEIFLPAQKQTYFFDENYEKGTDWYLSQFQDACHSEVYKAVGEISTGYCLPHAIPKMAALLPHIKIIMAMRHPVERAYSNYQTRKAVNNWSSFESALEQDPNFYDRGRYIEQIEALLEHYPREQLHFVLYDDLKQNDKAYLDSILDFLGIDSTRVNSQIGLVRNASIFPRLRKTLHTLGLKSVVNAISRSAIGDVVRKRNKKKRKSSALSMNPQTRSELVAYFKPYNEKLASFLNRNLDHWNN